MRYPGTVVTGVRFSDSAPCVTGRLEECVRLQSGIWWVRFPRDAPTCKLNDLGYRMVRVPGQRGLVGFDTHAPRRKLAYSIRGGMVYRKHAWFQPSQRGFDSFCPCHRPKLKFVGYLL